MPEWLNQFQFAINAVTVADVDAIDVHKVTMIRHTQLQEGNN